MDNQTNGYWVEVGLHGQSFRVWVAAKSVEEATEYVLENINIWVEDDDDFLDSRTLEVKV